MKTRRKQRHAQSRGVRSFTLVFALAAIIVAVGAGFSVFTLVKTWTSDLPDITDTTSFNIAEKTRIYANDGATLLGELYLEDREPVTIDQVSPYVLKGAVAVEDVRFYQHNGVDMQGIARAVVANITGKREGASTITQQFVRNTLLADEMTEISVKRKVREIELATQLEKLYDKDEILMLYLNTINFGDGVYGIEAAAQHYYNTSAADLTISQAATLIGIPNSPSLFNPVENPENALQRRNIVLSRMKSTKVISKEEYETAVEEPLSLDIQERGKDNGIYKYPWFTTYVREKLIDEFTVDVVFRGGLKVVTTLDPKLQDYAQEAVDKEYSSGSMMKNQELALTCVDPHTGFIVAMIGGKDFKQDQFNIATSAEGRQTGSSFKAFTLATAINKGISPYTRMNCNSPVYVNGSSISNYGGASYGTMTIADMTAISSNTGYIRLITEENGVTPDEVVEMATNLGLDKDNLPPYPSLTLGTGQANTTQMASAYSAFANQGEYHVATPFVTVENPKGELLIDNTKGTAGKQVVSKEVAYAVTQVLQGVIYKSIGTAGAASLPSGQIAAGKTGTTDSWKDLWWVGYTPQYSCAVWIGSRDNSLVQYTNSWAQNVWRNFMTKALEGKPLAQFEAADPPEYNSSYVGSIAPKTKNDDKGEDKDKDDASKPAESKPAVTTPDAPPADGADGAGDNSSNPQPTTPDPPPDDAGGSDDGAFEIKPAPADPGSSVARTPAG
ncbi:MAG: penicillin-binding protein [Eggerthellaceae bacterium]|nr:penicillin-binding protein [Eggerthellaceae bacterium]